MDTIMTNEFSLHSIAQEQPEQLALLQSNSSFTFQQLWNRVAPVAQKLRELLPSNAQRSMIVSLTAHQQIETLFTIYALLELRQPFALLHPAEPSGRRDQLLANLRPY